MNADETRLPFSVDFQRDDSLALLDPALRGHLNFFSNIKEGLEEALSYEKGKASSETIARKRSLLDVDV